MADLDRKESLVEKPPADDIGAGQDTVITLDGQIVNASGHRDQLQRGYGLLSICGLALSVDNAWVALGTSLTIAICMSIYSPGKIVLLTVARQRRPARRALRASHSWLLLCIHWSVAG